jgi:hypothetical protein
MSRSNPSRYPHKRQAGKGRVLIPLLAAGAIGAAGLTVRHFATVPAQPPSPPAAAAAANRPSPLTGLARMAEIGNETAKRVRVESAAQQGVAR